jgi:hypothetical protein
MQLPLEISLVALAAYILYLFVSNVVISRQNAAHARKLGCKEPPVQKNRYPLGIDNLLRAIAADKAKQFPVDTIKRTVDNGAITYKYALLGSTNYFTADEKNIQTILATNFSDWDVSSRRNPLPSPNRCKVLSLYHLADYPVTSWVQTVEETSGLCKQPIFSVPCHELPIPLVGA